LLLHLVLFLLPFLLFVGLVIQDKWSLPVALAAVSVLLMRTALSLRFRYPLWSVLVHPVSELILVTLGIVSWWSCHGGRGVEWKGRVYRAGTKQNTGSGA
jgi:hypothetical protein